MPNRGVTFVILVGLAIALGGIEEAERAMNMARKQIAEARQMSHEWKPKNP